MPTKSSSALPNPGDTPNTAVQNDLATRPALGPLTADECAGNAIDMLVGDRIIASLINAADDDVTDEMRAYAALFSAAPDMLAALKGADPLLMKLCTVAMNDKVADYLPFGLLDEVKDWLAHLPTQKAIAKAEGR